MTVLAIILARGGSKSLPRKNVLPLAGHPLVAYSIAAGRQARHVDRVLLSTDDEEIADIGRGYGAEAPFLRPQELAQDTTPDFPVVEHALAWLEERESFRPDVVIQLRPTSPLRPPDCVDRGIETLTSHPDADSVRSVVPSGQNPYKMWRISDDGRLVPLLKDAGEEAYNKPRQMLPATFWQTGHVDAIRIATILGQRSLSGQAMIPLLVDPAYAVDIDTARDLERAEMILKRADLPIVRPGRGP